MISKIITIDQSTSATKAMLFSEDCELLHRVNIEHQQFYPQIGWVEHDAEEIYKNTIEAIHCLLEQEEVSGKDWYSKRPDCLSILIFLPAVPSGYWIMWKMHVN